MGGLYSGTSNNKTYCYQVFLARSQSRPRSVQSSRWDGAIFLMTPGTSCLATIRLSLWDNIELISITPPAIQRLSKENSMTGCLHSTAESPERDVQSADGIFPIPACGAPEFAQLSSAANRGR